ncbi:exocyst complex component 7-like isoform X2 [Convolutriloba macropyga]|uniref:exocyst complex component 7-like isoform X2 n=1 Tax=Convolutriloba macropyga TaxID=536237 RepID=UPI003F51CC36
MSASNISDCVLFGEISELNSKTSENMHKHLLSLIKLLKALERSTMPLHQETHGLQNFLKNIEEALKNVTLIMGYYEVHDKYAALLSKQPITSVAKHLEALKEVKEAEEFFSSGGVIGTESKELISDFARGNENLFAHFRSVIHALGEVDEKCLQHLEKRVDTFIHRDIIYNRDVEERIPGSGDNVADLKDVVFWLCRGFSEGFDIVSSYSVGRSEFLIQCLKIFAERCRSQRIAKLEQDRAFRFLITTQNERIRIPAVPKFHKRRSTRLTRTVAVNPSLQMEAVGLEQSSSSFFPDPNLGDMDVYVYMQLISGFFFLCTIEAETVSEVVPRNKQSKAFENLCKEAARRLRADIEKLTALCVERAKALKTELAPLQCLFPLAEFMRTSFLHRGLSIRSQSQSSVSASLHRELFELYRKLLIALKLCLDIFYENIKGDNRGVPSDATVDELTVKSMTYMELVLFYRSLYAVTINMATASNNSYDMATDSTAFRLDSNTETGIYASFFSCLCSKLSQTISKSTQTDENRDKLFIFNNLTFIVDSFERFDLSDVGCFEAVQQAIERNIQVTRMEFMACWRKLNKPLSRSANIAGSVLEGYREKISQGRVDLIKMSDVERESVKNLFSTFNSDFELAHSLHKTLSIPSSKTYEDIRQEIHTIVEEPYKKFYDKYEKLPFTKFKDKYVKYTPATLKEAIDECYGYRR